MSPSSRAFSLLAAVLCLLLVAAKADERPGAVKVAIDSSDIPELQPWAEHAAKLITEWHPRVTNLLGSKDFSPPTNVEVRIKKTDQGVAGTANGRIEVSSHWIQKHPEDIGLIVHELTHIIQSYPSPRPGWLTEGIADYIRWAVYEAKPQAYFPVDKKPQGYKSSYQVTAGFLLWLENDRAPGIVSRLNAAMRRREYDETLWKQYAGEPLDHLWELYVQERTK